MKGHIPQAGQPLEHRLQSDRAPTMAANETDHTEVLSPACDYHWVKAARRSVNRSDVRID